MAKSDRDKWKSGNVNWRKSPRNPKSFMKKCKKNHEEIQRYHREILKNVRENLAMSAERKVLTLTLCTNPAPAIETEKECHSGVRKVDKLWKKILDLWDGHLFFNLIILQWTSQWTLRKSQKETYNDNFHIIWWSLVTSKTQQVECTVPEKRRQL